MQNYNTKVCLITSKDEFNNLATKVLVLGKVKTEKEYHTIFNSSKFKFLTIEDMRWIDENISEIMTVTAENRQGIIDKYFHGDKNEFNKHIFVKRR
jgi:hypothetical protein